MSNWDVTFHEAYAEELDGAPADVKRKVLAMALLLKQFGPELGRPHCDTLNGSRHKNMKELRFTVPGGVWRVAFAFDPLRCAVLLVGGNKAGKTGGNERKFYNNLIAIADARFDEHLGDLS